LRDDGRGRSFDGVERLERYLVELQRPELGWPELSTVAGRARDAAAAVTGPGRPVQFLRSVYVPEDGTCVFLYEGRSAADVRLAAEALGVAVARVVETVRLEPGHDRAGHGGLVGETSTTGAESQPTSKEGER
jgi:hypothetical protein